jgi:hypothetical protein
VDDLFDLQDNYRLLEQEGKLARFSDKGLVAAHKAAKRAVKMSV